MKPIPLDPQRRRELGRRCHRTHDQRILARLSAVLWVADGKTRFEVADRLGRRVRQPAEWLRLFRNRGLDAPRTLHHRGDPGDRSAGQVERLTQEISTGRFRSSDQVRHGVEGAFGVLYTPGGIQGRLRRVGASYHKVTGLPWKADPDEQRGFVAPSERPKAAAQRPGARRTRRDFVGACHPLWGLELVDACRLLVGQRSLAGRGGGRKRLNTLGAYCPDDREYRDLRLTRDDVNGGQFVDLPRWLRALHRDTERFVPYLDRAR
jgi:transposase